ncbi:MAG: radical SAM protein [Candidatus Omnitrophota bacterium]
MNAIDISKGIETAYPPLGLAYLSAILKNNFKDIQIKIIDRDVEPVIKSFCPDAVGVSSVSQNYGRAIEVGRLCKSLQIPVFIGGVHITLLPESLSAEFDFGVYGEAEETIIDIIKYFKKSIPLDCIGLADIKGLILHAQDGVKLTAPRPLIENLNSIPFPARDLLSIPIGQSTYMFTSRGCPYKCAFCASTRFWNNVRWFSAEYVVNEIEEIIRKYKPFAISFYDDLFIANTKRLEKIIDLLCAKGINKKVKFSFACRANLVNEKLIKILKPLDIQMICMGLESGCQKTLSYLKGSAITIEQNKKAINIFADAKINIQATFIIGSPEETEDEILQTLQFIKDSKLTNFEVYLLSPFPGTPVWETAKSMGLVSNQMDWAKLAVDSQNCFDNRIILSKISKTRLSELYGLFSHEKKRRKILYILKMGICNPLWVLTKARAVILNVLQGKDS